MKMLLQVVTGTGDGVGIAHEDAFMAIGYVAEKLEGDFIRYVPYLQPALIQGLKNFADYSTCTISAGLVGDLSRALGKGILAFCDPIMMALLELLQSPEVNKSVKTHVISAFADIALAIEGDFDRYSSVLLAMLAQANTVDVTTAEGAEEDEDEVDYVNSLHEVIFEAYSGIVQGLKEAGKQDSMLPFIDGIMDFLRRCSARDSVNNDVLKNAVGLLGDISCAFETRVQLMLRHQFVNELIERGLADEDSKENAAWAKLVVTNVLQGRPANTGNPK